MDQTFMRLIELLLDCLPSISDKTISLSLVFLTLFFFRLVLLGVVPFSLLLFLNIRVFSAINNRKSSSRDRNYSTILLLVVILFILCHFPRLVTLLSEC